MAKKYFFLNFESSEKKNGICPIKHWKKREIIGFDKNNKDEKHNPSSDECSTEASSNSDNDEEQSKNGNESQKSNQRQRYSWKEISANQSFSDNNNIIPFDIE